MPKPEATRITVRRLRAAGFEPVRTRGSHTLWRNGSVSVVVPDGHREQSPGVVRQVNAAIEEAGQHE